MIVCPNCNHQNPEGAVQCEACYTPLPAMMNCPNCGASVQSDASFCGQCGFNLKTAATETPTSPGDLDLPDETVAPDFDIPDLVPPDPLVPPEPVAMSAEAEASSPTAEMPPPPPPPEPEAEQPVSSTAPTEPDYSAMPPPPVPSPAAVVANPPAAPAAMGSTQLQVQTAKLLHVQTDSLIELPAHLSVIHIGKPNDRIPPDIDVSGFPDSEIVSRIHADIRAEADAFYIEDVGSSNGTYINNMPLPMGNRHRLRPGDRIALGKGDKVTFLFQMS